MPKGKKICSCGFETGARSKTCPKCGAEFVKKESKAKSLNTKGRGRKECPKCQTIQGVRVKQCVSCGHDFHFQPSVLKEKRSSVDWTELVQGDYIRVISGSGPYMPIPDSLGYMEKHNLGYHGVFKVKMLDDNGIHVYPVNKHESGHCFIYMGGKIKTKEGLCKRPHKIVKVKRKFQTKH